MHLLNSSGHFPPQPSALEVINKTGNTVYINGLNSGLVSSQGTTLKKPSIDITQQSVDHQQRSGGQLFKNVAIVNAAENSLKPQTTSTEEASHYGLLAKGIQSNSGAAHVSRAQKLKS